MHDCSSDTVAFRTTIGNFAYSIGQGEMTLAQRLRQKNPACPVSCSIDASLSDSVTLRTHKGELSITVRADDLSDAGKTLSVGLKCESIKSKHAKKSVFESFHVVLRDTDAVDCSLDMLSIEHTRSYLSYAVGQPARLLTAGPQFGQSQAGCPVTCTFRESLSTWSMGEARAPFTALDT